MSEWLVGVAPASVKSVELPSAHAKPRSHWEGVAKRRRSAATAGATAVTVEAR
jgi:hypothetical protein